MTRVLKSKRIAPKSGELRSVVVFLHGYGANGDDLLGLAEPLAEHLPDTLFVSLMLLKIVPEVQWVTSGFLYLGSMVQVRRRVKRGCCQLLMI